MSENIRNLVGVHFGFDVNRYHALPGASSSILRKLWQSTPLHLKAMMDEPVEPSPAMVLGTIGHAIALSEPLPKLITYPETYDSEDGKKKWSNNAKACKAWTAARKAEGLIPCTQETLDNAHGAAAALARHEIAGPILQVCKTEVTLITWDETNDIAVRCRLDIVPHMPFLADCKFSHTVNADDWAKHAWNSGYHIQAALYQWVWNEMAGAEEPKEGFKYLCVESKPPHDVRVFSCTDELIRKGREEIIRLLPVYAKCVKENLWPGSPAVEAKLDLPKWVNKND